MYYSFGPILSGTKGKATRLHKFKTQLHFAETCPTWHPCCRESWLCDQDTTIMLHWVLYSSKWGWAGGKGGRTSVAALYMVYLCLRSLSMNPAQVLKDVAFFSLKKKIVAWTPIFWNASDLLSQSCFWRSLMGLGASVAEDTTGDHVTRVFIFLNIFKNIFYIC